MPLNFVHNNHCQSILGVDLRRLEEASLQPFLQGLETGSLPLALNAQQSSSEETKNEEGGPLTQLQDVSEGMAD